MICNFLNTPSTFWVTTILSAGTLALCFKNIYVQCTLYNTSIYNNFFLGWWNVFRNLGRRAGSKTYIKENNINFGDLKSNTLKRYRWIVTFFSVCLFRFSICKDVFVSSSYFWVMLWFWFRAILFIKDVCFDFEPYWRTCDSELVFMNLFVYFSNL